MQTPCLSPLIKPKRKMWMLLAIALLFGSVHSSTLQDSDDIIELSENSHPDVVSEVLELLKDDGNVDKLMKTVFEDIQHHYSVCSCHHDECKCCRGITFFHIKMEVCVRLLYALRHADGYFILQADVLGHVVYRKEVDEVHFLRACHTIRIGTLNAEVCAQIAEVEMEPGYFSGCLDLVKPIKHEIGCLKLKVSSQKAQKKFIAPWDRFRQ